VFVIKNIKSKSNREKKNYDMATCSWARLISACPENLLLCHLINHRLIKCFLSILCALEVGSIEAYILEIPHCSALLTCGRTLAGLDLKAPTPLLKMVLSPASLYPDSRAIFAMLFDSFNGWPCFLLNFCLYVGILLCV
jgi:hypothetical protein